MNGMNGLAIVGMYVAIVPNRNSPPAVLLREALLRTAKSKNRTLANISHWPHQQIEALRQVLKGNTTVGPRRQDAFAVVRSLPHGHVATRVPPKADPPSHP